MKRSLTIPLILALLVSASSDAAEPPRPNILFIAVDDLRPEIGAYGVNRAVTPNIDALASKSVRFDRAYVTYPLCLPSRASMLTGRRIDYSGPGKQREFGTLIQLQQTWPASYRKAGYWTATSGKSAGVCERLVESIDLYPTLLALAGVSGDGLRLDGRNLVPLLDKPDTVWPHPAFIHAGKDHGMVTDQYRYSISNNGTEKLFDLRADPDEWRNLAAVPEHADRLPGTRRAGPAADPRRRSAEGCAAHVDQGIGRRSSERNRTPVSRMVLDRRVHQPRTRGHRSPSDPISVGK
jgi:arylsulfatase A-like enzyme